MEAADKNNDGVLQNSELSSLLRGMGYHLVIPDNKDVIPIISKSTSVANTVRVREGFMTYRNDPRIVVYLGRNDLEKYLGIEHR